MKLINGYIPIEKQIIVHLAKPKTFRGVVITRHQLVRHESDVIIRADHNATWNTTEDAVVISYREVYEAFKGKSSQQPYLKAVHSDFVVVGFGKSIATVKVECSPITLDDVPLLPEQCKFEKWNPLPLPYADMLSLYRYSAQRDPRIFLNGAFFEKEKNRIIATNGKHLIIIPHDEIPETFIMSWQVFEHFKKIPASDRKRTTIEVSSGTNCQSERWVRVESANSTTYFANIQGEYPDIDMVIPKNDGSFFMHRDECKQIAKSAIMARQGYGDFGVVYRLIENGASIFVRLGDDLHLIGEVDRPSNHVEWIKDGAMFDFRYLLDAIESTEGKIAVSYSDVVTALDITDGRNRIIIMPWVA